MLALWAILSASLLAYVVALGNNQPWADEWEFVPVLTGNEPVGPFFLQHHNEHRLPLPRLIYIGLWEVTHDFRSGMVLQVFLLSGIAYRGMRLAAWLRGAPHWADAFFPVSLLHAGHCENLLMGYQLCFVLAAALACCALELALRLSATNSVRTSVLASLVALALALSGGFGIVLAAPILAWVELLVVSNRRRNLAASAVTMLLMFTTVAYCGYYISTYQRPPNHAPFELRNWANSLQVAGQFLAVSLGIGLGPIWFLVLPLILTALGWAARDGYRLSDARLRSLGIAAVALGVILLSLAIGAGRGGFPRPNMGLWPRYTVMAWPLLAAIYCTAIITLSPRLRWLPSAMLALSLLAYVPNTIFGVSYGLIHDAWLRVIAQQLRDGVPVEEVVEGPLSGTGQEARAQRGIPMLRDAKIGPYADWKAPP